MFNIYGIYSAAVIRDTGPFLCLAEDMYMEGTHVPPLRGGDVWMASWPANTKSRRAHYEPQKRLFFWVFSWTCACFLSSVAFVALVFTECSSGPLSLVTFFFLLV